ncbi:MAG: hypothetical protein ABI588_01085 [Arenimonas sp.]
MLVTLHKDGRSSFLGEMDDSAIAHEHAQLEQAGLKPTDFTVELPYTTHGAAVLAPVLLAWRLARPGRSVTLTMHDHSSMEIGEVSAGRIEWMLPLVTSIAIVEQSPD